MSSKSKPVQPIGMHQRLLDGYAVGGTPGYTSRATGLVHTIHGADGKTVAECYYGSSKPDATLRFNVRQQVTVGTKATAGLREAVKRLTGRSSTWTGGGFVVTDESLPAARLILASLIGAPVKPKATKPKAPKAPKASTAANESAKREAAAADAAARAAGSEAPVV